MAPACTLCSFSVTGTGKNYILDGQHTFAAATAIREELLRSDLALPRWVQTFRCRRVDPRCSMEKRRLIAGREQARTATVMQQTLSQKLSWFLRDYNEESNKGKSRTELLREVYLKTGCTKSTDGTLVCIPALLVLLCVGCCFGFSAR